MQNFIGLYEILMPWTLTVHSEMLPFSRNNQNIIMFGVPPNTLPLVMYKIIIYHWAILHYNMPFQTIAGRSNGIFWWFPALSEDKEKNCRIHQNYLVALTKIWKKSTKNVKCHFLYKLNVNTSQMWRWEFVSNRCKFHHQSLILPEQSSRKSEVNARGTHIKFYWQNWQ